MRKAPVGDSGLYARTRGEGEQSAPKQVDRLPQLLSLESCVAGIFSHTHLRSGKRRTAGRGKRSRSRLGGKRQVSPALNGDAAIMTRAD